MTDKLCVLAPTWETVLSTNETVQKIFSSVCQDHWTRASLKRNQQEPPLSGTMNSIQHETIQVLRVRQAEHSSWSWEEQPLKGFYTNAEVQDGCSKKLNWNGCEAHEHPSAMFLSILDIVILNYEPNAEVIPWWFYKVILQSWIFGLATFRCQ